MNKIREYGRTTTRGWLRCAAGVLVVAAGAWPLPVVTAEDNPVAVKRVTIQLVREATLSAQDSGTLQHVAVAVGDRVAKGQLIARLEHQQQELEMRSAELQLEIARMQAEDSSPLDSASAQLAESQSALQVKKIALQIAEVEAATDVGVRVARAEAELRKLELQRASNARQSFEGSVSRSRINRLETDVRKGELDIEQAEIAHKVQSMKPDAERAALTQKEDEVRRYQALVAQSRQKRAVALATRTLKETELRMAQVRLDRRSVYAPFDGIVVQREVNGGEWVERGAPVARIVDLNVLAATGYLPVAQTSLDLVGRTATVTVLHNGSQLERDGIVRFVSPEVDPVNQQVQVRVEFDNQQGGVFPGMNGTLVIH